VIKSLGREICDRFSFNSDQSRVSVMTRNYVRSQIVYGRIRKKKKRERDLHLTANRVTFKKTTVDSISMSYLPTSKLRSL